MTWIRLIRLKCCDDIYRQSLVLWMDHSAKSSKHGYLTHQIAFFRNHWDLILSDFWSDVPEEMFILIFNSHRCGGGGMSNRRRWEVFFQWAGSIYQYYLRCLFSWRDFFLAGFFSLETVTDLGVQRSMIETESKSERASQTGQENGRERRYNKFYFLTWEKKYAQTKTPTTTSYYRWLHSVTRTPRTSYF